MRELVQIILDEQRIKEDLRGAAVSAALAGALLLNPLQADAAHTKKSHMQQQVPIEVRMLVGEAENQGLDGMRAVASAFRNLEKLVGHKKALAWAYGTKRKLKKKPPASIWSQAAQAWKDSATHDYANGANHWGTDEDVKTWESQPWFKNAVFVGKVGDHNLYKEVVP
jgi:hypothetical protein